MHDFKYIGNRFYCESLNVESVARKVGTPFYLYSHKTLLDHFRKIQRAFKDIDPLICFSMKANSSLALVRALVNAGAGLDIVSGGELFKALKVGCPGNRIVYASVGKTEEEILEAIKKGILFFNVESLPELDLINEASHRLNKVTQVAIRINPDVEPGTHQYITTGKLTNKFGMDFLTARKIFEQRSRFGNLNINGIHMHIGSQIIDGAPFLDAIRRVIRFIDNLRFLGIRLEYLNIGGGLGIIYKDEKPQTADQFAQAVLPLLKKTGLKIILEPGRFIVGNAGILVTKVLYIKKSVEKTFVIVDAGMNDLIRPSLYQAYHEILPLNKYSSRPIKAVDVVGPICESGDFFAKNRKMCLPNEGDLLAIMSAGAYGFSMSSNYNSRKRTCEILAKGSKFAVIRKRQSYQDLVEGETIPNFIK
ncbi:MAG: diaminopimelate decarboxylase [Candidatus Omnitrophica bacterium]|nr:diaminopimelate decarboxylase [Candidatus Omnitrophota bacterium]HOX54870.1 diaminopimelate decarboxylase [Candidatus Omnitrophota bacterium]